MADVLQGTDFDHVLTDKAFRLAFQPIIRVATGKIHHYEALLRGEFPTRDFITWVEDDPTTAMILDLQVLDRVLQTIRSRHVRIAVNFSGASLQRRDFQYRVLDLLQRHRDIVPFLSVEITETVEIHNFRLVNPFLLRLKEMGVEIILDDFGSGYATFEYVRHLSAITVVKIDQTLWKQPLTMAKAIFLLRACHKVLVMEGVTTRFQAVILRLLRVKFAQGYFYGGPESL